ncbi:MAG: matrixin family metalloprotease [Gemmatimonadales bacterium]|jgi:hypothetical protein
MTARRTAGAPILLLAAALLAVIAGDALWGAWPRGRSPGAPEAGPAPEAAGGRRPASVPTPQRGAAERAALRERIAAVAAESYLAETVAGSDSTVRRWGVRGARSLTVAVVRSDAPGFQGEFVDAAGWAMAEWNQVGLPVRFEALADSAHADVVVSWADTIDAEREGRADVTWNGAGEIIRVRILLATHLAGGRAITPRQMTTMALHELGHALGLGHSPDPRDALYPTSGASALTPRDRRTATVLYELPTGSVRN